MGLRFTKIQATKLSLLFNGVTYLMLFLGTLYTFWIINLVTLGVYPIQFDFSFYPSNISVLLYTLNSFFFSDGGQMTATGNFSELVRVFAGIFVVIVLGYFVLASLRAVATRDDKSIEEIVQRLRKTADQEEDLLKEQFRVGVTEAANKLAEIGKGFGWLLTVVVSAVPEDFVKNDKSNK